MKFLGFWSVKLRMFAPAVIFNEFSYSVVTLHQVYGKSSVYALYGCFLLLDFLISLQNPLLGEWGERVCRNCFVLCWVYVVLHVIHIEMDTQQKTIFTLGMRCSCAVAFSDPVRFRQI